MVGNHRMPDGPELDRIMRNLDDMERTVAEIEQQTSPKDSTFKLFQRFRDLLEDGQRIVGRWRSLLRKNKTDVQPIITAKPTKYEAPSTSYASIEDEETTKWKQFNEVKRDSLAIAQGGKRRLSGPTAAELI
ncbi:unnamed protein product, partial [Mesorhabditis spiculigera]